MELCEELKDCNDRAMLELVKDAVGKDYFHCTLAPQYVLARKLFRFATFQASKHIVFHLNLVPYIGASHRRSAKHQRGREEGQ